MTDEALRTLENAFQHIVNEMFQNGPEEGCRIWEDVSHPLQQAVVILLRVRTEVRIEVDPGFLKEAAMLLEQHRRAEEA